MAPSNGDLISGTATPEHRSGLSRRRFTWLILILAVTNLVTATLLARYWRNDLLWRLQAHTQATHNGIQQAVADFRDGHLRVYRLVPDGRAEFTGEMDGPFEIWDWPWNWPSYPKDVAPFKYTAGRFVEAYNFRMRNMVAKPESFKEDYKARKNLAAKE